MRGMVRRTFFDPYIGSDAVYRSKEPGTLGLNIRVVLNRNTEVFQGEAVIVGDQVCFLNEQVPNPAPGDVVELYCGIPPVPTSAWRLVERVFTDEEETRWLVRPENTQNGCGCE